MRDSTTARHAHRPTQRRILDTQCACLLMKDVGLQRGHGQRSAFGELGIGAALQREPPTEVGKVPCFGKAPPLHHANRILYRHEGDGFCGDAVFQCQADAGDRVFDQPCLVFYDGDGEMQSEACDACQPRAIGANCLRVVTLVFGER